MSNVKPTRVSLTALVGLLVMMFCSATWAGVVAGRVVFARGVCAASVEGGENTARLLGANTEIYEGDMIQTGTDSFVVVEFADKARITIRPNSSFRVQKYSTEGAQEAKLVLEKGSINASMGQIAKAGSGKFQVDTPVGSIKSQGADFNANLAAAEAKPDNSVARVVQAQGKVEAIDESGAVRNLAVGQPLYEKERVRSQDDAYAVLVFRDGSKTTVQPGSELEISTFRYQPGDNANNKQLLKLIAGGVRALTGAIGKEQKENVQLTTPVATIGIRGTIFYHHHLPAPLNGSPAGGYTHVNQGGVWHSNAAGISDLGEGKTGYIANFNSPQSVLAAQPTFMQHFEQMTPSPADIPVDPALLSKASASLTVQAKGDGKLTVSDKQGGKTELGDKQTSKTTSGGGATVVSGGGNGGDGKGSASSGDTGTGSGSSSGTATTGGDADDGGDDVEQSLPGSGGGLDGSSSASGC